MKSELTFEQVAKVLKYCPESGAFTRLTAASNQKVGSVAGSLNSLGYVQIGVLGEVCLGHRLAIFMSTGAWPSGQVDHINRNRADNRLSNLRVVSAAENKQNCAQRRHNKSGVKGVHYCSRTKKWVAQIAHNKQREFLGRFATLELAAAAYSSAAAQVHKFNPAAALMPDGTFVKEA